MTSFPHRAPVDIHVPVSSLTRLDPVAPLLALCDECELRLEAWQVDFLRWYAGLQEAESEGKAPATDEIGGDRA